MFSVRAIVPDSLLIDPAALQAAIAGALDDTALEAKQDFEATVASWNEKPEFRIEASDPFARVVSTENEIYSWVNDGTKPHEILPVRAQALRFITGGMAKTQPGALSSGPGSLGNNLVFANVVHHPGTTARDFDAAIQTKEEDRFAYRIQEAINQSVK